MPNTDVLIHQIRILLVKETLHPAEVKSTLENIITILEDLEKRIKRIERGLKQAR